MLTIFKEIFTWWNHQTIGTRIQTFFYGKYVGKDESGNKYYESKSGKTIPNPVFYYVFGLFKIAVIAQQIYFRYKKGFTKDRRFGLLNLAVMSLSIMAKQAIVKNRLSNLFE